MTAQEIANAIYNHLGGDDKFDQYYIGITDNIERRLYDEHKVDKESHWAIYAPADDDTDSRAVEKHFLDKGMKGGGGGGDTSSIYVYCYRVTDYTVE